MCKEGQSQDVLDLLDVLEVVGSYMDSAKCELKRMKDCEIIRNPQTDEERRVSELFDEYYETVIAADMLSDVSNDAVYRTGSLSFRDKVTSIVSWKLWKTQGAEKRREEKRREEKRREEKSALGKIFCKFIRGQQK